MVTKRVKVLLAQNVSSVGKSGDVINVPLGFFRNFLSPKGLAFLATKDRLDKVKKDYKLNLIKHEGEKKESLKLKNTLQGLTLTLELPKNEKGTLFSAVKEKDILKALLSYNITLPSDSVFFDEPIKHIGIYNANIKLPGGVKGSLKIEIK